MATSPPNEHPTRINAPLNFRHTNTLITTKVPHYPTKVTTGMSIIPGWNRPNANGINANINDKDYNGPNFKPRPLKHWRRQLRVYDYKGGANNSRAAVISQLDRPGLTVYHFKPDCACVPGEGGNSYIISNNKFGYETKDDNYSKAGIDVQIQNNGYSVVPYDATAAEINDPSNPAYKVLTGVYNTNCINCSPQGNVIKSGVAIQSQAYYSYSNDKLESRCQTYEQNLSTNKSPGCVYFDGQGIPLWPSNARNGPQVVAPVNYGSTVYKGNYFYLYDVAFTGRVFGGSELYTNSVMFIPKINCIPLYVTGGFYVNAPVASLIQATLYDINNTIICKSTNIEYTYINTSPESPIFSSTSLTFYFPKSIYINPPTTYYVEFKSLNDIPFNFFISDDEILSGIFVAEPFYCLSKTIYKPNNVAFGRQGAVSGSTRLKKLVSDTITVNGYSYYSAKGAEEANFGKYQGTNFAGNYYVKMKEVINSCLGTVPSKPILTTDDIESTSITISWFVNRNGSCEILFYTLTYYPITLTKSIYQNGFDYMQPSTRDVNNATTTIIYPNSNNTFNVSGLAYDQVYDMYITATNGNGESQRSDIMETNTLLDADIQITLNPVGDIYTYNATSFPVSIIVTITSLNTFTNINSSLINLSNANVASLVLSSVVVTPTLTTNTYTLTLFNSGTFNIYAIQQRDNPPLGQYGTSTATYPVPPYKFTINSDIPIIQFSSFNTTGTYGSPYALIPAVFTYPIPAPPGVNITYSSTNTNVATVSGLYGTTVAIVGAGQFQIKALTNQVQNYYSVSINSPIVTISKGTITINFTGSFVTTSAYGSLYTITGITFTNQEGVPVTGIPTTYTSSDTSVATVSGTTVTIVAAGVFNLIVTTASTENYNGSSNFSTVYITHVPEVIVYNNPQIFPKSGSTSGEVGLIIGIPSGSWSVGFSNFTGVTITNTTGGGGSFILSSGSAPTYSACLNKYLVFGEPATAGFFINNLSTSTASNIAYVTSSNLIANGVSSGQIIQFVFTGGTGSGVPSSYTCSYNPGSIDAAQGIVSSYYSSITSNTISAPPSGESTNGSLTVGWKGYDVESTIASTVQEAWGVSANSGGSYPTYSPLINTGLVPNQIFYPQTNIGTGYYYYIGIPKMIAPYYV